MCCEEIYKRIGELILARRNQEEQKFYKLQDSLNRDDLLNGNFKSKKNKSRTKIINRKNN